MQAFSASWFSDASRAVEFSDGEARLEVLNTVTFAELNGQTTLTLHGVVVKSVPALTRALEGMEKGWSQKGTMDAIS